jgi:hypothetical protein
MTRIASSTPSSTAGTSAFTPARVRIPHSGPSDHGVRQFGNFGAHPNDDLLVQVDSDDAKLALEITKKILKELYK